MKKIEGLALLVFVIFLVSLTVMNYEMGATNKVTTLPATNITATSATLNASVEPDGCGGSVAFSYATANVTPPSSIGLGLEWAETLKSGFTQKRSVSTNVTNLTPGTTYEYSAFANSSCNASDVSYGNKVTFTTLTGKMAATPVPGLTFAPPSTTVPPGGGFLSPSTPPPPGMTPPPQPSSSFPSGMPPPIPSGTVYPSPPELPMQCPPPQPLLQPTEFPPPQPGQPELPPPQPPSAGTQNMTLYIGMGIIGLLLIVLIVLVVMMNRGKRPPRIYSSR